MNRSFVILLSALGALFLAGCNYTVPVTAEPTRKIDARLLGNWVAVDKDSAKEDVMRVRAWDEAHYAVGMDNDLYRVFHSDVAGLPLVCVQDINSSDRKYCCFTWRLSADGESLSLRALNNDLVPDGVKSTAGLQKLIREKHDNPALFREELVFRRKTAP